MRCHCGRDCLPQHLWVLAEALGESDRVNDGGPDSHCKPLCAGIYGTAEVRTDKLDPRGRETASSDLIPGCFILNHHPRLGPNSGTASKTLLQPS